MKRKYGDWTVIRRRIRLSPNGRKSYGYDCVCKCGRKVWVGTGNLKNGASKRCRKCGYLRSRTRDAHFPIGRVVGKLTIIGPIKRCNGKATAMCRCSCGTKERKDLAEINRNRSLCCKKCRRKNDWIRSHHPRYKGSPNNRSIPLTDKGWTKSDGTGVYIIHNLVNGAVYVGSSAKNIQKRWAGHKCSLNRGIHGNRHLQRAWNKYGEKAFQLLIIELVAPTKCLKREQFWIDSYVARGVPLYNLSPKAGNTLGRKFTEETKAKISASRANKTYEEIYGDRAEEMRRRRSEESTGRKHTPETIAKMREHKFSAEHRKKLSLAGKRRYQLSDRNKS